MVPRRRSSATSAIVPAMPRLTTSSRLVLLLVLAALGTACSAAGASPIASTGPSGAPEPCREAPPPAQSSIPDWSPGSQDPTVVPVVVSSGLSIACGPNRFMFSFLDEANTPVAAPDRTASVAFYDLAADPETPVASSDGTFLWGIEGTVGIYVVSASFASAGLWGAEFTTTPAGGSPETIRLQFEVHREPLVVSVGDPAPASDTPTLADVGGDVAMLSTDKDPVERFYETSIADAIAAKEPFIVVFATPKFCASAQCGPTLDRVKPVAAANPDLTVINVEPYQLEAVEGQLQPVLTDGGLTLVQAARDWKLLSEPWIFVVDGDGIVAASFEGIVSEAELQAAVDQVTGD
jgi:hypothetical protein